MTFELNKKNIILIIVFTLLVIAFGLIYNFRYQASEEEKKDHINLVNDYSRFFTISNSANTYINYLAKKDEESLYLLLSDSYKAEKNIAKNNVLNKLENLTGSAYSFQAKKIYQEKLSDDIVKYYVYGYLREEIMDEYVKPTDYYLILIMDTKNFTFSVTPYDGKIFKEAS